jgi:cysteine desulfurase family protein
MVIYLDNAATSFPKPSRVYERLREFLERYGACPGRGGYEMAREAGVVLEETRALLAELFHVQEPSRIVFTLNATDALNMAIKGALVPGDHVVTTVLEHNSVIRPLNRLERQGLITLTQVEASSEGLVDPADIRKALTAHTKLVAVIHGSNVIGSLQPIETIGGIVRQHGALLLVDASQTAGAVPLDVEASCIDLLAFPGHKALLGPPGTGGLYVGSRARLAPWREGGTGVFSDLPLQPEEFPYYLEAGSPNTLGIALLGESVRFILQYGVSWIRTHELELTQQLLSGLAADERCTVYGPKESARRIAVVSVNVQGRPPDAIGELLSRRGIAVRTGLHCAPGAHQVIGTVPHGTIRISPGYFTKDADIARCLDALRRGAGALRPARKTRLATDAPDGGWAGVGSMRRIPQAGLLQ